MQVIHMQEIRSSNVPVVTRTSDPNKFQARDHRSMELDSKLKYLNTANIFEIPIMANHILF